MLRAHKINTPQSRFKLVEELNQNFLKLFNDYDVFWEEVMNNSIAMKRFEVIVEMEYHDALIELLKRSGIRGYTVIKDAGGRGARGLRNPDDRILPDENAVTIFACKEDLAQKVLNELQPAMKGFGGICMISDCHAQTHFDN